jgi:hypothetical protein
LRTSLLAKEVTGSFALRIAGLLTLQEQATGVTF